MNDVTVVIPCYNAERWVGRAIRSALAQEGVAVEVIVVDDGSTDASVDVVESFGDRISWETGPNRGACAARNRGLELARAPFVQFLDADDYIEGPFLSAAVRAMSASGADLGFGVLAAESGSVRRLYEPGELRDHFEAIALLLRDHFIPPCSTVWRRDFVRRIGGWRYALRRNQDLEIVFRALSRRPLVTSWCEGRGVYFQHRDFTRISHLNDPRTVADQMAVLRYLREAVAEAGVDATEADALIRRKAYQLCRMTARASEVESYEAARSLWRQFGGRRHRGSWRHVVLATLLGLRKKEHLSLRLADHRRRRLSPARG